MWIWASVRLPPIKLITYFHGSRALRWPNAERSPRTLSKGNKNAREKNSIQLWQNIRYNPSPPFNNPHTYPLFPTTSCLTLQPTTAMTIPDFPMSSTGVLNWQATRTPVGPLLLFSFRALPLARRRSITRVFLSNSLCSQSPIVPPLGLATTPAKRGRGRPKGSKNKKSAAGTAASTSEVAPAAGEKRKRGRPPKVCSAELLLNSPRPRPHAPPGPDSP